MVLDLICRFLLYRIRDTTNRYITYIYTTGVGNLWHLNVQFMFLRKMHQYLENGMFIFLPWPLFNRGRFCNFFFEKWLIFSEEMTDDFFLRRFDCERYCATGVFGNR